MQFGHLQIAYIASAAAAALGKDKEDIKDSTDRAEKLRKQRLFDAQMDMARKAATQVQASEGGFLA